MFNNGLRPAKLPTALALGALLIFLYVFICNISNGLANSAVFPIKFEKKSLAQAMEILANSTQTQITLIGDLESKALNSRQIESQAPHQRHQDGRRVRMVDLDHASIVQKVHPFSEKDKTVI